MKKKVAILILISLILFLPSEKKVEKELEINNTSLISLNLEKSISKTSIKNLAVFIKFKDSNAPHSIIEEESIYNANTIYNSDYFEMDSVKGKIMVPSFKTYFEKQSYGNLSITTELLPKEKDKVTAYIDTFPIEYYLKYNEQNTIGYKNTTEKEERETMLLNRAVAYVQSKIGNSNVTKNEIDSNNDGFIDAISFIVEGEENLPSSIMWGDLLWSHKSEKTGIENTILGKKVKAYNLLYAEDYTKSAALFSLNRGTYGTIIHEFGHTLGFIDQYTYGNSSKKPVGFYDIMGDAVGSNPQNFLTYFISDYNEKTNWHERVEEISKTTKNITLYKPKFIDSNEKRAVKLKVDGNEEEYFYVEYHEKQNTYDTYSADSSGIIVYRVNEKNKYNDNNVYIFRPGETNLGEGKGELSKATLNKNRPIFGKNTIEHNTFDNETIHFSNGTNTRIKIEVVDETKDSITFHVLYPEYDGKGTKEEPYLIDSANTFIEHMKGHTKDKYYKITKDLDFSFIENYPLIEFAGNLDGNNKTISNVKTNGSGLFQSIGHFNTKTTIKNLNIENINVSSNKKDYLGGLSNTAENILLKNIHIKSGNVKNEGTSINSLVSTGGFLGNATSDTVIEDCSTNVSVSADKNVGGLLGINLNAILKNSFATGVVSGTKNIGGIIGIQAITENHYNIPENVFYKKNKSNLLGVGGYESNFHNLNVLKEQELSKGIIGISNKENIKVFQNEKITIPIETTPFTNIQPNIIVENEEVVKKENNFLTAKKVGSTKIYLDIKIGQGTMRLISNVKVKEGKISEEEMLKSLGLIKKEQYLMGISLQTEIKKFRETIASNQKVTLKSLKNASNKEETSGIIKTGMKLTLVLNEQEYQYTIVIKGDVNGDGYIYATDYVKVKNHIMGKTKLTGAYLIAADIDNDKNIYATDYVKIKNHIMEKSLIVQK